MQMTKPQLCLGHAAMAPELVHRRCYELSCRAASFKDGLNITNDAQYACLNTDSIVVRIVVRC